MSIAGDGLRRVANEGERRREKSATRITGLRLLRAMHRVRASEPSLQGVEIASGHASETSEALGLKRLKFFGCSASLTKITALDDWGHYLVLGSG